MNFKNKVLVMGNYHNSLKYIESLKTDIDTYVFSASDVLTYEEILADGNDAILFSEIQEKCSKTKSVILITSGFDGKFGFLRMFVRAYNILNRGGNIEVICTKKTGARYIKKLLIALFDNMFEENSEEGGKIFSVSKSNVNFIDFASACDYLGVEAQYRIKVSIRENNFIFMSEQSLFSKDKADRGSLFLLNNIEVSKKDKVLDYGCGYGIIGITIAKVFTPEKVCFIDIDCNAYERTRQNIGLNGIECPTEVLLKSSLDALYQSFSLIVSHFPLHVSKHNKIKMLRECYGALCSGGRLVCVIPTKYDFSEMVLKVFDNYSVKNINSKEGYYIFEAKKL